MLSICRLTANRQRTGLCSCACYSTWRRKWQPTPVLLPGKSHGQRSLVGYSPWSREGSTGLSDFTLSHTAVVNYDATRGRWCPRYSQPPPDSAHPGRLASARFFQFKWKAKCRRREPVHGRLLTGESVQGCLFRATGRTQAVESLTGFFLAASHAAWLGL